MEKFTRKKTKGKKHDTQNVKLFLGIDLVMA